ncbi:protein twisted gastrulation-like [Oratosquilla oratoria]|uniref:protein twisted gastrulation-like n=1 Tax=Oratosquilla oratoria TaxID=337810 RepID=UPI003F765D68
MSGVRRCGVYVIAVTVVLLAFHITFSSGCNEAVCASQVSKCMLTQSCNCDLQALKKVDNYTCADCAKCLAHLYFECCSCVGMCKPPAIKKHPRDSQVGETEAGYQELFELMTKDKHLELHWTSFTFPIDISITEMSSMQNVVYKLTKETQDIPGVEQQVTVNCTVAFLSQCMSWNKCKEACGSMGAQSYRWFYDGCCECVGSTCINYGLNESRCIQCPEEIDEEYDELATDEYLANHFN